MSSADSYLYDTVLESGAPPIEAMLTKELLYVLDNNSGSYNGSILIDTSSLSNSGRWCAYSEAYLTIPYVLSLKNSVDSSAASIMNGFVLGMKSGYHQIIDSMQVDYNNTNVVQLQPYLNFYAQYKMMTSWSQDDLNKYGASCGFYPDTAQSFHFSSSASVWGDGTSNNQLAPITQTAALWQTEFGSKLNSGLLKRMQFTAYPIGSNQTGYGGGTTLVTTGEANLIAMNYFTDNAGGGAARIWSWNMIAVIRLKDLADFFDKIPLVKGAYLRFTINYNSCSQTVTCSTGASLLTASTVFQSGRTNPMIMGGIGTATGIGPSYAIPSGTLSIACGIRSVTSPAATNPLLTSCRLYVSAYELNPEYERNLLTLRPSREISYEDIYNFNITAIGPGGSFNSILTNGLPSIKYVVVIPFLNSASASVVGALSPYQSCFDTAPGTSSPQAAITNWQVQVGGRNIFQQPLQYDFNNFLDEVVQANAVNGSLSTGVNSGLLDLSGWENGYRYYVANVARRLPQEDTVPKSVAIQGTNDTSLTIDLVCFIAFERRVSINMYTGALN